MATRDTIEVSCQKNFLKEIADALLKESNKVQRLNALDLAGGAHLHYPKRHIMCKRLKGNILLIQTDYH
jgi:gamma-glutamyl phosphate reductase